MLSVLLTGKREVIADRPSVTMGASRLCRWGLPGLPRRSAWLGLRGSRRRCDAGRESTMSVVGMSSANTAVAFVAGERDRFRSPTLYPLSRSNDGALYPSFE